MPNAYQPVSSGSSLEQAIAMFNNNFAKLDNEAVTKVFRGAGGINTFTLGQIKDVGVGLILRDQDDLPRIVCYIDSSGTPILKVSKDGYDATTTGDENLIFNSAQNVFKIADKLTTTLTGLAALGPGDASTTITHGLGYSPVIVGYLEIPGFGNYPVPFMNVTAGVVQTTVAISEITTTTFKVKMSTSTAAPAGFGAWPFTYYLLQETAN